MTTIKFNYNKDLPSVDIHPTPMYYGGKYLKLISPIVKDEFTNIYKCGLLDELINKNLIPYTKLSDYKIENYEDYLVFEQEEVDLIYPHEFSFSMLKDCALSFLELSEIADKYGYSLKDCHAHNFGYKNGKFVYVDIGSFQTKKSNQFEFPYQEYFAQYIIPLKFLSDGYPEFASAFLEYFYGEVPSIKLINEYLRLNNKFLRFFPSSKSEKIIKYWLSLRRINQIEEGKINELSKIKRNLINFLKKIYKNKIIKNFVEYKPNNIKKYVYNISYNNISTTWGNYYDLDEKTIKEKFKSTQRFNKMIDIIKDLDIESITDIGSNMGLFLFNLFKKNNKIKKAYCIDPDIIAIDKLYLSNKYYFKFPVVPIVNNPFIPRMLYFHKHLHERAKSDIVSALALTHHLLLTQNLKIEYILEKLINFTRKYLLIEFMPLGLWDGKRAPELPAWYNQKWFEENLKKYFKIIKSEQTEKNRIYYLCIKKEF